MIETLLEWRVAIQSLCYVIAPMAAFRWGSSPEKSAGLTLFALWSLEWSFVLFVDPTKTLTNIDIGHAMINVVIAIALVVIALNANRLYTMWLAAFQLVALFAHFARAVSASASPVSYETLAVLPSYFQIAIFAAGLHAHHHREKAFGAYRSWRHEPPDPHLHPELFKPRRSAQRGGR